MGEAVAMELAVVPAPGPVKRIWLMLYTEGGWWSGSEIQQKLHMGRELGIRQLIHEMVRNGFLSRRNHVTLDGDHVVQYGIQRMCKVPRGVTVDEIWELMQQSVAR